MYEPSTRDPQTFEIIGAAIEVHRRLHRGLFEGFYCEALAIEFQLRGIPFEAERPVQLAYKGHSLKRPHHMDFVCFGDVVVEVKAVSGLTPADEAQLLNYLDERHQARLAAEFWNQVARAQANGNVIGV